MSQVVHNFCDVCKREVKPGEYWDRAISQVSIGMTRPAQEGESYQFDVCGQCRSSFHNAVREWKQSRLSTPEGTESSVPPITPEATTSD